MSEMSNTELRQTLSKIFPQGFMEIDDEVRFDCTTIRRVLKSGSDNPMFHQAVEHAHACDNCRPHLPVE